MKHTLVAVTVVLISVFVATVLLFGFVLPREETSGVIGATQGQCLYNKAIVRKFHILLGQRNDYNIVKRALLPAASVTCGQKATFKLLL